MGAPDQHEKERVTLKAAIRLLKTKIRAFIYNERHQEQPWVAPLLQYEEALAEDATEDWHRILKLWGDLREPHQDLIALIKTAHAIAEVETESLLNEPYVPKCLELFRTQFRPESLLVLG